MRFGGHASRYGAAILLSHPKPSPRPSKFRSSPIQVLGFRTRSRIPRNDSSTERQSFRRDTNGATDIQHEKSSSVLTHLSSIAQHLRNQQARIDFRRSLAPAAWISFRLSREKEKAEILRQSVKTLLHQISPQARD